VDFFFSFRFVVLRGIGVHLGGVSVVVRVHRPVLEGDILSFSASVFACGSVPVSKGFQAVCRFPERLTGCSLFARCFALRHQWALVLRGHRRRWREAVRGRADCEGSGFVFSSWGWLFP